MNQPLSEFRLGIIGGCLSHQPGIPKSKLYHQQLAHKLKDQDGIKLSVKIERKFEFNYQERLLDLLENQALDAVLLHSRVVFIRKTSLVVNYTSENVKYYLLHPYLFHRREFGRWFELERQNFGQARILTTEKMPTEREFETPSAGTRIGGFRLRDLNFLAGRLLGLDRWAIADELFELTRFQQICQEKNIPFFVLGPTPFSNSWIRNQIWAEMEAALQVSLPGLKIPYCSVNGLTKIGGAASQYPDGIHLTEAGHRFVAEQLHACLTPWMKSSLGLVQPGAAI